MREDFISWALSSVIEVLAGLIQRPSVNPSISPSEGTGEAAVAEFAREWLLARPLVRDAASFDEPGLRRFQVAQRACDPGRTVHAPSSRRVVCQLAV
jgi:acetylornithine deacetylase/succinyl-diaminopimelate desuccinylase-like protein